MWTSWLQGYRQVQTQDGDEKGRPVTESTSRASSILNAAFAVYSLIALLASSAFIGLYLYYAKIHSPGHNYKGDSLPCGNSSAEARSLGCNFDQLTWAWMPSYCPQYTNDRFLHAEPGDPWKYFTNPYTKQLATAEDLEKNLNNEGQMWGERREHLAHCVFMFLNLAQIFETGGLHTKAQVDHEHMEHCGDILLEALKLDKTRYMVETKVPYPKFDQDC